MRIVRSWQERLEFEVMILWTSPSKVFEKGDLMVIVYLQYTVFSAGDPVFMMRREFVVGCAFLPWYAGSERGGIEGWGEVFGHEKCQG